MKKSMISKLASALLVATSMTIIGCGSGGSDSATDQTVSGSAVDGYIKNATVCLDLNKNNVCDIATEPTTQTDVNGKYALALTPEQQASDSPLLVVGGIDVDTNAKLLGALKAPLSTGTVNITPITSMIQAMVANGTPKAEAEAQIAIALNIPLEHIYSDPVAVSINNPEIAKVAIIILRMVEMLSKANTTATNVTNTDTDKIFEDLASAVGTVAADNTVSGVSAIVHEAAKTSAHFDSNIDVAATKLEIDIDDIFTIGNHELSEAALLADALADAIERLLAIALGTPGYDFETDFETDFDEETLLTDVTEIAVYNIFHVYDLESITSNIITEIASNFTDAKSVTEAAIISLRNLSVEAQAAVSALQTPYHSEENEYKVENVEIYLKSLGVEEVSDLTMSKISTLSDYKDTMTKDDFVIMLRASGEATLVALADVLEQPGLVI